MDLCLWLECVFDMHYHDDTDYRSRAISNRRCCSIDFQTVGRTRPDIVKSLRVYYGHVEWVSIYKLKSLPTLPMFPIIEFVATISFWDEKQILGRQKWGPKDHPQTMPNPCLYESFTILEAISKRLLEQNESIDLKHWPMGSVSVFRSEGKEKRDERATDRSR